MGVSKSQSQTTYDKLLEVLAEGQEIANILELIMDEQFIKQSRHDWCWVGWEDVPTETGWHRIDRENQKLLKITDKKASGLEWHERLFVYGSGHAAVSDENPLALYIGDEYSDGRLSALYLCGPDVLTWVAVKTGV